MAIGYVNPSSCVLGYTVELTDDAIEAAESILESVLEGYQYVIDCIERFEDTDTFRRTGTHPELPRLYALRREFEDERIPSSERLVSTVRSENEGIKNGSVSYFGSFHHDRRPYFLAREHYYAPTLRRITVTFERGTLDYGPDNFLLMRLEGGSGANGYLAQFSYERTPGGL